MMIELSKKIKLLYPNKIIFSGGPEVGYDTKSFVKDFDYIISGEGEEVIIPFIDAIINNGEIPGGIASINNPIVKPLFVKDLNNVPSIIDTYTEEDIKKAIKSVYGEGNEPQILENVSNLDSLNNVMVGIAEP